MASRISFPVDGDAPNANLETRPKLLFDRVIQLPLKSRSQLFPQAKRNRCSVAKCERKTSLLSPYYLVQRVASDGCSPVDAGLSGIEKTDYTSKLEMPATPQEDRNAPLDGAAHVAGTGEVAADPESTEQMDQEVIARVLAGSKDAFGVLVSRYSDPLYRHALGMTGSPDVAEDILQASFIKAYQHLSEVRGRFDAWVFRIVANSCKDWLKNIRRTHVSYDEDDQPSLYSTPEEEMDRNELRSDLEVALGRLAPSLRESFVMKHVEGRSYEEMAILLETTVGALKMRVHRAREALQQLLEEKYA